MEQGKVVKKSQKFVNLVYERPFIQHGAAHQCSSR